MELNNKSMAWWFCVAFWSTHACLLLEEQQTRSFIQPRRVVLRWSFATGQFEINFMQLLWEVLWSCDETFAFGYILQERMFKYTWIRAASLLPYGWGGQYLWSVTKSPPLLSLAVMPLPCPRRKGVWWSNEEASGGKPTCSSCIFLIKCNQLSHSCSTFCVAMAYLQVFLSHCLGGAGIETYMVLSLSLWSHLPLIKGRRRTWTFASLCLFSICCLCFF